MSHPIDFLKRYETATEVFGKPMQADELRLRVSGIGWKGSLHRLAQLAAMLEHATDEEVRQRTVDPILRLTGNGLAAHGRGYVAEHRDQMLIAHEEVILFLQHLVIMIGSEADDAPDDPELSLWILGANCHLEPWEEEGRRELSATEQLVAVQARSRLFNTHPDRMNLVVRSRFMLRQPPPTGPLASSIEWQALQQEAFGASMEAYYSDFLMPLFAASQLWGHRRADGTVDNPVIDADYWKSSRADRAWIKERLDALTGTRESLQAEIEQMLASNGLPRAPSALRRRPLVLVGNDMRVAASPAALRTQLHTGVWAAYLNATKRRHAKHAFQIWSNCFGYLLEIWCANNAHQAAGSRAFRTSWTMKTPSSPGAVDEIEDVILLEDKTAILFSVKSALLPEKDIYRSKSKTAIMDWLERFLFSMDGDFKGALVKLDAKIVGIRNGKHIDQGMPPDVKIVPVLVTYEGLGEDVLFYRWIREQCRTRSLMAQHSVAPMVFVDVEEFESLMAYAAEGRSLLGLMNKRKPNRPWYDRRMDQQLAQISPRIPRSAEVRAMFNALVSEAMSSIKRPASV